MTNLKRFVEKDVRKNIVSLKLKDWLMKEKIVYVIK